MKDQDLEKKLTMGKSSNYQTEKETLQAFKRLYGKDVFSLEEMKQAFEAGKEWIWEDLEQTTMSSKYESFEEWFEKLV